MSTDDFIMNLFFQIDTAMVDVPKHPGAHRCANESVRLALCLLSKELASGPSTAGCATITTPVQTVRDHQDPLSVLHYLLKCSLWKSAFAHLLCTEDRIVIKQGFSMMVATCDQRSSCSWGRQSQACYGE